MIIGLTGRNGAGKGVIAEFLKQRGFIYTSLSDVLRDQLKAQNKEITRENLIRIGNELRSQLGPSALADKILERLDRDKNYVVDSIRNPSEVMTLRSRNDFTLILVEAPLEIRFKRIRARSRRCTLRK